MGGANAQDPQGWERHWGLGGWGLGSGNRQGPGVPPTPGLRGRGPHLGAQQASWARVGGAVALLSSPAPLVWEGPSRLPLLISPASLLCLQDQCGCGGAWRMGDQPGSSGGSPCPSGRGNCPPLLSCSSGLGGPLPPASPDLPGLRGADPVWPPLLLPLCPPTSYQFTWGFLPSPWASESHTSSWQAP